MNKTDACGACRTRGTLCTGDINAMIIFPGACMRNACEMKKDIRTFCQRCKRRLVVEIARNDSEGGCVLQF